MRAKKSFVLSHIWKNPGSHRKEIARLYKIHPTMVTDAVRELIRQGWVVEGQRKAIAAGRSPVELFINGETRAVVAVSYDNSGITCGLVNAAGKIIRQARVDYVPRTPEGLVGRIGQLTGGLVKGFKGRLLGCGLADPGMIDNRKGLLVRSGAFPGWRHVPLARMLEEKTQLKTCMEDLTRSRAMAEYQMTPEIRNTGNPMLYLDYGEGVGVSLVHAQGPWRGMGFAGEMGHVVMDNDGSRCRCGARGCLESMVSPAALVEAVRSHLNGGIHSVMQGKPLTPDLVFKAAMEGDRLARSVIEEEIRPLGLALAVLMAAVHPGFLVVGGECGERIKFLAGLLETSIRSRILPEIASSVQIREGKSSKTMALIGVGLMAFDQAMLRECGAISWQNTTREGESWTGVS